jgi:decaprenylphospho-beta-D-ribofuranose 2-oxidase
MTLSWDQACIMNWSMTERSPCYVCGAQDVAGITQALTAARRKGLTVIAHGAGHSYTDAALNTNGVIVDVTGMRRILSWDAVQGIMQVEPGVTVRDVVRVALADRWWPAVAPSAADATIGGCVAMNVNGKNAWKCGSFGEHLLSLTVLLATGQELAVLPESDPILFHALVGSAGLLGIITSITLQLQPVPSSRVDVLVRSAASFGEMLAIFQEEQSADFLEGWVDGFASGRHLGRGIVTSTRHSAALGKELPGTSGQTMYPLGASTADQLSGRLARRAGEISRPAVNGTVRAANGAAYWLAKRWDRRLLRRRSLVQNTFYSPAVYAGYRSLLPQGSEAFQAFVPRSRAEVLFKQILERSQESNLMPLWCVIKQHRRDPFLLSYQLDGFSLEVNYQHTPQRAQALHQMLGELMDLVIASGGRFYLAKDSLLTRELYRQSIGDAAVEAFLELKRLYDPEMRLQSNLFRRVFQAPFESR